MVTDLKDFDPGREQWDAVISIFCHVPPAIRVPLHTSVVAGLKKGGVLVLEAFDKDQLRYGTGGPPTEDMLMSLHELKHELKGLEFVELGHCGEHASRISQALTWSSTVIMKIDIVDPRYRGLAMGLNKFSGYGGMATIAWLTGWLAETHGLRPTPLYPGIVTALAGLLLSASLARETVGLARGEQEPGSSPGLLPARSSKATVCGLALFMPCGYHAVGPCCGDDNLTVFNTTLLLPKRLRIELRLLP